MTISEKKLWDVKTGYTEVWFSPTGFGPKDDAKSVGFVAYPKGEDYGKEWKHNLIKKLGKNYQLSPISTYLTDGKKWEEEVEVQEFQIPV